MLRWRGFPNLSFNDILGIRTIAIVFFVIAMATAYYFITRGRKREKK
ncbi:MAG: hypothetical protein Q8936_11690 [Bacillota bacterium]|nr:hypothetical protein [Bacillota bacterium]